MRNGPLGGHWERQRSQQRCWRGTLPALGGGCGASCKTIATAGRRQESTKSATVPGLPKVFGVAILHLVLPVRIELTTSPLPRECSTTELRQQLRVSTSGRPGRAPASAKRGDPCHKGHRRASARLNPLADPSRSDAYPFSTGALFSGICAS